eukprot:GHVU01205177.1.p1 GENE.GHVU01205177.1~~GHVU01205177.1.p1  ORF type:complete len:710 (+),score=145.91 GHVU01205177.1:303-2432(+)
MKNSSSLPHATDRVYLGVATDAPPTGEKDNGVIIERKKRDGCCAAGGPSGGCPAAPLCVRRTGALLVRALLRQAREPLFPVCEILIPVALLLGFFALLAANPSTQVPERLYSAPAFRSCSFGRYGDFSYGTTGRDGELMGFDPALVPGLTHLDDLHCANYENSSELLASGADQWTQFGKANEEESLHRLSLNRPLWSPSRLSMGQRLSYLPDFIWQTGPLLFTNDPDYPNADCAPLKDFIHTFLQTANPYLERHRLDSDGDFLNDLTPPHRIGGSRELTGWTTSGQFVSGSTYAEILCRRTDFVAADVDLFLRMDGDGTLVTSTRTYPYPGHLFFVPHVGGPAAEYYVGRGDLDPQANRQPRGAFLDLLQLLSAFLLHTSGQRVITDELRQNHTVSERDGSALTRIVALNLLAAPRSPALLPPLLANYSVVAATICDNADGSSSSGEPHDDEFCTALQQAAATTPLASSSSFFASSPSYYDEVRRRFTTHDDDAPVTGPLPTYSSPNEQPTRRGGGGEVMTTTNDDARSQQQRGSPERRMSRRQALLATQEEGGEAMTRALARYLHLSVLLNRWILAATAGVRELYTPFIYAESGMPSPAWRYEQFPFVVSTIVWTLLVSCSVAASVYLVASSFAMDKEGGARQVLEVSGAAKDFANLIWFLFYALWYSLLALVMAAILHVYYDATDFGLVFLLLFLLLSRGPTRRGRD